MLSIIEKLYERILVARLTKETESQLEDTQCGFRKGRGVQDHIFVIKQLIEKFTTDNIFVAFIDIEKAFDSILRNTVWNSLVNRRVNGKLVNCIKSLYQNTRNVIRTGNTQSEEFETKEGLRQGGVLSPVLFNLIMDDIIKEIKEKVKKMKVGYKNMEMVEVRESVFADDLVIYAKNEQDLKYNLEIWNKALLNRNLKINIEKTKVMVIGREDREVTIKLNGKVIEQVEVFKYLGVKIQKNGRMDAELNERIESANKVYYSLSNTFVRKREISKKTKLTVYNTIFKPILMYGSESWVISKRMESKIQAVEMRYLRGVVGITRRDKIRNVTVREQLEVEPILTSIKRQRLRWFGHLVRMGETRTTKKVWQARPHRKRTRGRPRKSWDKEVTEILRQKGMTWNEGRRMARNKQEWARKIYS